MPYPSLEQYNLAFQTHGRLLADPELADGTLATTGLGLPHAISGGFALTYTISSGARKFAVRCFHRESKALERRYEAIARRLGALASPFFLDFEFQPKGIRVDGAQYPIVKMAWAKGETLGEFLEARHKDRAAMGRLCASLAEMAAFLEASGVAHGDVQTGNIMVSDGGATTQLIDYDGMYVDEIEDVGSAELGHVNFQHPQRKQSNPFGPALDRFAFISMFVALEALRADPAVWDATSSEVDALVFRANDFADPEASPAFALLASMPAVAARAKGFAAVCLSPMDAAPSLADFIAGKGIPAASVDLSARRNGAAAPGGYVGPYAVVAAADYDAALRHVGDKVEAVGKVVEVRSSKAVGGKPYVFVNFGDWRGKIFKIAFWADGLAAVKTKPGKSWVGQWVSVVGLMEPPYSNKRWGYTHLSIAVNGPGQVALIDEREAKRRLAGAEPARLWRPQANAEALAAVLGKPAPSAAPPARPAPPPHRPAPPAAVPGAPLTPNQAALAAIRTGLGPAAASFVGPASAPSAAAVRFGSANRGPSFAPAPMPPIAASSLPPINLSAFASPPSPKPTAPPPPPTRKYGWPIVALAVTGALFVAMSAMRSPQPPALPDAMAVAARNAAEAASAASAAAAARQALMAHTDESAPPRNHRRGFTMPQLRYCAATAFRMEAWKDEARAGAPREARRLRAALADFAARCGAISAMGDDIKLASDQMASLRPDIERRARAAWQAASRRDAEAAASAAASAAVQEGGMAPPALGASGAAAPESTAGSAPT